MDTTYSVAYREYAEAIWELEQIYEEIWMDTIQPIEDEINWLMELCDGEGDDDGADDWQ